MAAPLPPAVVSLIFVVEGIQEFVSDIKAANSALDSIRKWADNNVFSNAIEGIGNAFASLGNSIWNVVTIGMGVMLRDSFHLVFDLLQDLVTNSFDAANELQGIQFRLQGFNLQAAIDSGLEYNDAMTESIRLTEEQMSWVMRLAAQSPFDATDIGFVFSMSEAFGFTSDEAKVLTQSTMDFVAAMGLSSIEQKRVIINLGQMAQRGKITTREMNDLARGSLLPLADVLDRVALKMGITTAELTKLIAKPGEGVDYQLFIDSFNEMIGTEERFIDSGKRMAMLFKASMDNVYQTTRDLIGYYIMIPGIIGPIGEAIGTVMEGITQEDNWNKIIEAASRVGEALTPIVEKILNVFLPGAGEIVNGIVGGLDAISGWLTDNKDNILRFFSSVDAFLFGTEADESGQYGTKGALQDIKDWIDKNGPVIMAFFTGIGGTIKEGIVKIWEEKLKPAYEDFSDWVTENKPTIDAFWASLGGILKDVIDSLLGIKSGHGPVVIHGVLDKILSVMKWITENEEQLSNFAVFWANVWLATEKVKFAAEMILKYIGALLALDIPAWALLIWALSEAFIEIKNSVVTIWNKLTSLLGMNFSNFNPFSGFNPFPPGFSLPYGSIIPDLGNEGEDSTSKTQKTGGFIGPLPDGSVSGKKVGQVTSTSATSTVAYNLTINTKAPKENILQDYAVLESMNS